MHHGAKWGMAKKIVGLFPAHRIYVEPFCGSCAVLFAKGKSFVEVINDRDDVIVNVFKQLRDNPLELAARLWAMPYAKTNWQFKSDDEAEKAALAIAKAKQFYIGNQTTSTFSIDACAAAHKPKGDVWAGWHERVIPAASRLKHVQILNKDALEVIEQFRDNPEALLYIDPPYVGHEREYRYAVDYGRLIELCTGAAAQIVISEFELGASRWPEEFKRTIFKVTGRSASGAHRKTKTNTEVCLTNFEVSP